ncbi:ribokinase [Granulicella arctica]|uniref:Deoxyribokinase n=2 Tax=Granulicella arctica TaxID=940613 RepID=A0A7Y9PKG2_9BACT|nr:ribokinase [Granulicella arctica]
MTADRLPQRGETIPGTSFQTYQGGKGANQAVAAAMLGATVMMVGKVGSDAFGAESIRQLQSRGVDCTHVATEKGDSGLAVITVGAAGENTILVLPGANAAVSPEFVESKRAVIRSAGIVLAQLEIPVESVLRLGQVCAEEGVPLMLDPAPARELPQELFALCRWLTPNETEAMFYAGEMQSGSAEIAGALLKKGAQGVVLKLGEKGAAIYQADADVIAIDPMRVSAVDTTAAGDTFNGALAAALTAGNGLAASGRIASAAAALSVTRMGAQASMPGAAEVSRFLKERNV